RLPGNRPATFVTDQPARLVLPRHIEAVAEAAAAAANFAQSCGVGDESAFGIDIAVREAVTNAIVHANKEDETKSIEVSFNCVGRALEIEIKDQGEGFDAASVPDPTVAANLLKTSGRGIFLMRNFMDEVRWSSRPEGGTTLHMVKRF